MFDSYNQLNTALGSAQVRRLEAEMRHRALAAATAEEVSSLITSPALQTATSQLASLQAEYALLTPKFGSNYPRLVQLRSQLDQVRSTINMEVTLSRKQAETEYRVAQNNQDSLAKALEHQKGLIFGSNEASLQYQLLQRQVTAGRDLIETLTRQLQVARLSAGLNSESITILDHALRPTLPVSPRKTLNIEVGFAGGLFLGLLVTVVLESLNAKILTVAEAVEHSQLPLLTLVPVTTFPRDSGGGNPSTLGTYVIKDSRTPFAEAFRRLRSSVLLSKAGKPPPSSFNL